MSSFGHDIHLAHSVLEKTKVGHKITAAAAGGAVAAAKLVGGAALASATAAAAPVVAPLAVAAGLGYAFSKLRKH